MIDKRKINKDALLYVERADIALQHIKDGTFSAALPVRHIGVKRNI